MHIDKSSFAAGAALVVALVVRSKVKRYWQSLDNKSENAEPTSAS